MSRKPVKVANKHTFYLLCRLCYIVVLLICNYDYREDMYAQDSIDLLQNSGLQFRKHEEDGIEPLEFAELLMSSGQLCIRI